MPSEITPDSQTTTGSCAIDVAIASSDDFDGSPIPYAKLELISLQNLLTNIEPKSPESFQDSKKEPSIPT